jgi:hypothetical protein
MTNISLPIGGLAVVTGDPQSRRNRAEMEPNGLFKGEICGFSSWRLGVGEGQIVLNRATYVCATSPGSIPVRHGSWMASKKSGSKYKGDLD